MINKKIGILGGGQLGKMLYQEASKLSLDVSILDKSRDYPAGFICKQFVEGDFRSYDDVLAFGKGMDIITIEIESVNTEALHELKTMGKEVYPQPEVIDTIKDKGLQKSFYDKHNIPSSKFILVDSKAKLLSKLESSEVKLPFVQKLRTGGYDGRGVQVIRSEEDYDNLFDAPCVIEDLVNIKKEISIIVARNVQGESQCYIGAEMIFNPEANLLDYQIAPAEIDTTIANKAKDIALQIVDRFKIVGLLAVELFIDQKGEVLVNEVAPRPHNSGHHTIEGAITSQYEQHMRAILGLPLGPTDLYSYTVLLNVLGEPGHTGEAKVIGMKECMSLGGVHIHLYGKEITKPYRKMGHVTIMDKDLQQAIEKSTFVKQNLKVIANG